VWQDEPRTLFRGIEQTPIIQLFYSRRVQGDVLGAFKTQLQHGQNALTLVDASMQNPTSNIAYLIDSYQLAPTSRIGIGATHRSDAGTASSTAVELFALLEPFRHWYLNSTLARSATAGKPQDHEFSLDFGFNNGDGRSLMLGYQDVGPRFDINPSGIISTVDRLRYKANGSMFWRNLLGLSSVSVDGTYLEADIHDGRSAGDLYRGALAFVTRGNHNGRISFDRWGDRVTLSDGTDLLYWADDLVASMGTDPRGLFDLNVSAGSHHAYDFEDRMPIRVIGFSGTITLHQDRRNAWMSGVSNMEYARSTLHDRQEQLRAGGDIILVRNIGAEGSVDYNSVDGSTLGSFFLKYVPDPDQGATLGIRVNPHSSLEGFLSVSFRVN